MTLLFLTAPALGGLLMLLIYVVVFLIVTGLIFWCINKLIAAFGIPEPIRTVITVAYVIFVIIAVAYFLLGTRLT